MSDRRDGAEDGQEGDVSDRAGDRLGGDAAKAQEIEIAPQDQPAAPTPEP